jgi:hypothetical protein
VTLNKFFHHPTIKGSRTVKSIQGGEIFNVLRFELSAYLLHPRGLKLKHRIGAPFPENRHRLFVVKRYISPVNLNAKQLFNAA